MLSYSFSKREKALLVFLALVLVGVAWFALVFQGTNNEIISLESQINDAKSQEVIMQQKVGKLDSMRKTIEDRKAAGATYAAIPNYDNLTQLMAELDRVMAAADSYTVSFDKLDKESVSGYVLRGTQITFDCGSYDAAKSILTSIVNGRYPCSVGTLDITSRSSRTSPGVTVSVHVTYIEKV